MIRTNRAAFTLIEILVVVVILGIIATAAIPIMGSTSTIKLSSASQVVMSDLMYAQNYAITKQQSIYVIFRTGTSPNGIDIAYKATPSADADYVRGPDQNLMKIRFGSGASSDVQRAVLLKSAAVGGSTSNTIMYFDSLGQPYLNGTTTPLTAASTAVLSTGTASGAPSTTLTIQPYTGEISVQ